MAKKKTLKSKEKIEKNDGMLDTNLDDVKIEDVNVDELGETANEEVEQTEIEEEKEESVAEIGQIDVNSITEDLDKFKEELFKKEEKVEEPNKNNIRKPNYMFGFMWNGQEYD